MKNQKKNILVITPWSINDALIQTYTLPYLKIVRGIISDETEIHLVTQEKNTTHFYQTEKKKDFIWLPVPYFRFGFRAMLQFVKSALFLKKYIKNESISILHSWCTPAGMTAYFLHQPGKIKWIADSFEPHAEALVENGTWRKNSMAFRILFHFEKKITQYADELISIAPGMSEYIRNRYEINRQIKYIKPAAVDLKLFSIANKKKSELIEKYNLKNKIVCLYAGKFGGIYLDKEVFDFFHCCVKFWQEKVSFLLLTNESQEKIKALAKEYSIPEKQILIEFVAHKNVPDMAGLADFAICPVKPVPTKKYCSPIKTGEYWALGLPVLIPVGISNDSQIIEENNAGYVWNKLCKEEYESSIKFLDKLLSTKSTKEIYETIRPLAERFRNFSMSEKIYTEIYREKI